MNAGLRHRPIFGGVFGMGRYALASLPCVVNGLHAVRFMVIDPTTCAVLSLADQKVDAMSAARDVLRATQVLAGRQEAQEASESGQAEIWPREERLTDPDRVSRPVSRRRSEIYQKCQGGCHYCQTPLQLDGPWHVEHMLPRALGGRDEIGNLVAACAPCNLSKGDKTALEFVIATTGGHGRP